MSINISNGEEEFKAPLMSKRLADYLMIELSGDKLLNEGLVRDNSKHNSEAYLLGMLAGLAYSRSIISVHMLNQSGTSLDTPIIQDETYNYLSQ